MNLNPEILSLVNEYAEGSISAVGKLQLEQRLGTDKEVLRFFVEYMNVDAALDYYAIQSKTELQTPFVERCHSMRSRRSLTIIGLCCCSLSMAFMIALWFWGADRSTEHKPWDQRQVVGRFSQNRGGKLLETDLQRSISSGETLKTGMYHLTEGLIEVVFSNSVRAVFESPALFEVVNADRAVLLTGRVSAHVPPSGIGFTIETPSANVVDLGTDFSVEVMADRGSEVHVFEGQVDVYPKSSSESNLPVRLVEDMAIRIDPVDFVPLGIDIDRQRFVREFKDPADYLFSKTIRSLNPTTLYRMSTTHDGQTILQNFPEEMNLHGWFYRGTMQEASFVTGRIGSGLRLGGPAHRSFGFIPKTAPLNSGKLSVGLWAMASTRPADATALDIIDNRSQQSLIQVKLLGLEGDLACLVRKNEHEFLNLREVKRFPLEQWSFLCVVIDGSTVQLFRNGQFIDSNEMSTFPLKLDCGIYIGAQAASSDRHTVSPGAGNFWHGRLDELSIFDYALSQADIEKLYDSAKLKRIRPTFEPPAHARSE